MASSLLDKVMGVGSLSKRTSVVSESTFFGEKEFTHTGIPIIDIAFSGRIDGGMTSGLTVVAGKSKSFKSLLGLLCMKAFLDKSPENIAILYDSEFGITPSYLRSFGIDTARVIHIPIMNVEELKQDLTQKLVSFGDKEKGKIFIMLDSLGNLASLKEATDAEDGKSTTDMSRAQKIKSLFRIVTPYFTMLEIPCYVINHIYDPMGNGYRPTVSGGQGVMLSANNVWIITKAQEKVDDEIGGWTFTIDIEKSRFVKERAKLKFTVMYEEGFRKWSSLFDLAVEAGYISRAKVGWWSKVDLESGEVDPKSYREKALLGDDAFFESLCAYPPFRDFVTSKYQLSANSVLSSASDSNGDEDVEEPNNG